MESTLKSNQLNFIEGQFTAEEAKEILTNIFVTKIKFHELKNFSTEIRDGQSHLFSQNRIKFLNEELLKIEDIINEAKILNKKLILKSEIIVSFCD
jgi:hypothetical protein